MKGRNDNVEYIIIGDDFADDTTDIIRKYEHAIVSKTSPGNHINSSQKVSSRR